MPKYWFYQVSEVEWCEGRKKPNMLPHLSFSRLKMLKQNMFKTCIKIPVAKHRLKTHEHDTVINRKQAVVINRPTCRFFPLTEKQLFHDTMPDKSVKPLKRNNSKVWEICVIFNIFLVQEKKYITHNNSEIMTQQKWSGHIVICNL